MSLAPQTTLPGFTDPVHDAQRCFRAVLDAFSKPGTAMPLISAPPPGQLAPGVPASCLSGLIAAALTLCDSETPVWLDAALDTPAMRRHFRFHCGCRIVAEPKEALFSFIGSAKSMPRFCRFSSGCPEYPDRSATLVIAADLSLPGREMLLSGPGISPALHPAGFPFAPSALPEWFWEDWAENHAAYPLGVDIMFVDSDAAEGSFPRIAALPRSTAAVPGGKGAPGAFKEKNTCTSR